MPTFDHQFTRRHQERQCAISQRRIQGTLPQGDAKARAAQARPAYQQRCHIPRRAAVQCCLPNHPRSLQTVCTQEQIQDLHTAQPIAVERSVQHRSCACHTQSSASAHSQPQQQPGQQQPGQQQPGQQQRERQQSTEQQREQQQSTE